MGIVGKKPKPARLKVLTGNPGRREIPVEPTPPPGDPVPPSHLDDYALEEWRRLSPGLQAANLLTPWDQAVLGAYCDAYSVWRAASEELQIRVKKSGSRLDGMVEITKSHNTIQSALASVRNKAREDMVKFGSFLALNPAERARIGMDSSKMKSKFEGLIGIEGGKKQKNAK